ncbi:MAG: DsbA family oxidoreductase [Pseudomonadota bacterium]|nr:DsbA family oxidoreductase [Pseudomonadota bacterium]
MQIEIFSDVICPWCFIGKKRLDNALVSELDEDVVLRWRPYMLYPKLPVEGINRQEFLTRRYGDTADPGRIPERIRIEAEGEGIELRFDLIGRTPNTMLAHRLMEFAHTLGRQHDLAERLFQAYFCEGKDVGDIDELVKQGAEIGLPAADISSYLSGEEGLAEVTSQLQRAPELGVSGVPGYYLADAFLLPGAQTSETMLQIIRRVRTRIANRHE